jgi:hypothetical protein
VAQTAQHTKDDAGPVSASLGAFGCQCTSGDHLGAFVAINLVVALTSDILQTWIILGLLSAAAMAFLHAGRAKETVDDVDEELVLAETQDEEEQCTCSTAKEDVSEAMAGDPEAGSHQGCARIPIESRGSQALGGWPAVVPEAVADGATYDAESRKLKCTRMTSTIHVPAVSHAQARVRRRGASCKQLDPLLLSIYVQVCRDSDILAGT